MTTTEQIQQLRKQTGCGLMDCKSALEEAQGDFAKALEILRKKGMAKAIKKANREACEGVITAYIHSNKKVGAMVQLACETDFVARTEEFQQLAYDIAMHIAAQAPLYIKPEDIPENVLQKEKEIYREQLLAEAKPENIIDKIIEGKIAKYYEDVCLIKQKFIKDDSMTIEELINSKIGKMGEKIEVQKFSRFSL